jgi:hypothetical protein
MYPKQWFGRMKTVAEAHTIRRHLTVLGAALAVVVAALPGESWANMYGFECFTQTGLTNQLSVEVEPYGQNQVVFTFSNSGPAVSSIHEVYFEDGSLLRLAQILDNPDAVDFWQDKINPGNLPSWENLDPDFHATLALSVDTEKNAASGVNGGETLGLVFDLINQKTFSDVLAAINLGFTNPDPGPTPKYSLRVGLHVGDFGPNGESQSFIMSPPVPLPGAVLLGSLGLGVAACRLRGRKESV